MIVESNTVIIIFALKPWQQF